MGILPRLVTGCTPRCMALAVCAVLTAVVLGGCGTVGAEFATDAALEHAGYRNVNMNDTTGSGAPRGGVVGVT